MSTTRDLAPLIAAYLDEHGIGTVAEIARSLKARDAAVRATLTIDGRFVGPFTIGTAQHPRRVFLAPLDQRDNLGRAAA